MKITTYIDRPQEFIHVYYWEYIKETMFVSRPFYHPNTCPEQCVAIFKVKWKTLD